MTRGIPESPSNGCAERLSPVHRTGRERTRWAHPEEPSPLAPRPSDQSRRLPHTKDAAQTASDHPGSLPLWLGRARICPSSRPRRRSAVLREDRVGVPPRPADTLHDRVDPPASRFLEALDRRLVMPRQIRFVPRGPFEGRRTITVSVRLLSVLGSPVLGRVCRPPGPSGLHAPNGR